MKNIMLFTALTALFFVSCSTTSHMNSSKNSDDLYWTMADQPVDVPVQTAPDQNYSEDQQDAGYSDTEKYYDENGDTYITNNYYDYGYDDYWYTSHLNHWYQPCYGFSYWSPYYHPWYWSPGFSVTFNFGYGGWYHPWYYTPSYYSWYGWGYPYYNYYPSYYSWYSPYNSYYNGYWDGYYDGYYGGYFDPYGYSGYGYNGYGYGYNDYSYGNDYYGYHGSTSSNTPNDDGIRTHKLAGQDLEVIEISDNSGVNVNQPAPEEQIIDKKSDPAPVNGDDNFPVKTQENSEPKYQQQNSTNDQNNSAPQMNNGSRLGNNNSQNNNGNGAPQNAPSNSNNRPSGNQSQPRNSGDNPKVPRYEASTYYQNYSERNFRSENQSYQQHSPKQMNSSGYESQKNQQMTSGYHHSSSQNLQRNQSSGQQKSGSTQSGYRRH